MSVSSHSTRRRTRVLDHDSLTVTNNFTAEDRASSRPSSRRTALIANQPRESTRRRASGTPSTASSLKKNQPTRSSRRKRRRVSRQRLDESSTPDVTDPLSIETGTCSESVVNDPATSENFEYLNASPSPSLTSSMHGSLEDTENVYHSPPNFISTPIISSREQLSPWLTSPSSPSKRRGRPRRTSNLTRKRKPIPVDTQFNRSFQMSLTSQPGQTDWLSTSRSLVTSNTGDLLPIKMRRPSESTFDGMDLYCWICHRPGQVKSCTKCPRVYHPTCCEQMNANGASSTMSRSAWHCSVCRELELAAADASALEKWRPVTSVSTYELQLQRALAFLVDFLSVQNWAEPFREPVLDDGDLSIAGCVRFPMALRTLLERVNAGRYKSTHAFLADFQWIVHNSFILEEKSDSSILVKARSLERMCLLEISLLRACPTCYLNRTVALPVLPSTTFVFIAISKCDPKIYRRPGLRKPPSNVSPDLVDGRWFTKPCSVIHPLVWVRSDEGSRWPAKLMEISDDTLLLTRFGNYTSENKSADLVTLHTGSAMVNGFGVSSKSGYHCRALDELHQYVASIMEDNPTFELPPRLEGDSLPFTKQRVLQYYGKFNKWLNRSNGSSSPNVVEGTVPIVQIFEDDGNFGSPDSVSSGVALSPQRQEPADDLHNLLPASTDLLLVDSLRSRPTHSTQQPSVSTAPPNLSVSKPPLLVDQPSAVVQQNNDGTATPDRDAPVAENADSGFTGLFANARTMLSDGLQSLVGNILTKIEEDVHRASAVSKQCLLDKQRAVPNQEKQTQTVDHGLLTGASVVSLCEGKMKSALLKSEIHRLSEELERQRIQMDISRFDIARTQRAYLIESRAVWDAELTAVVEAVAKIYEQEVIRIIDQVKKKQWCTYCGNEAFFYCCWNTSYCNTTCQQLHWPSHMSTCLQSKQQQQMQQQPPPI